MLLSTMRGQLLICAPQPVISNLSRLVTSDIFQAGRSAVTSEFLTNKEGGGKGHKCNILLYERNHVSSKIPGF